MSWSTMRSSALRLSGMLAVALLAFAGVARAQDSMLGAPQPDKSVRDAEFGVIARHLGLERRVEMLQWQRTASGYAKVWSERPIDSSSFAPGKRNPGEFPLHGQRWMASVVRIDDKPVDPQVIVQRGVWQDIRPSFSALPDNLAATFQPEGDGLGSAENPLEPHVGDLRIRWRDLVLPTLDGQITLRGGRWQLLPEPRIVSEPVEALTRANDSSAPRRAWIWMIWVLVVLGLAGVVLRVRRRR
ncbi:MAG: TMEM43 family protein [Luteimonas sp.]